MNFIEVFDPRELKFKYKLEVTETEKELAFKGEAEKVCNILIINLDVDEVVTLSVETEESIEELDVGDIMRLFNAKIPDDCTVTVTVAEDSIILKASNSFLAVISECQF